MELAIPVGGCPLSCAGIKPAGLHQASSATQKELLLVNGELLLSAFPKIRQQTRRQIFSILVLYLNFFFPSCWYSGVFSLSWYEMDQGWMKPSDFVRPGWRGLCVLSAHSSAQVTWISDLVSDLLHRSWRGTEEAQDTEHKRHQDYCGAPGQWGRGNSFAALSHHSFY